VSVENYRTVRVRESEKDFLSASSGPWRAQESIHTVLDFVVSSLRSLSLEMGSKASSSSLAGLGGHTILGSPNSSAVGGLLLTFIMRKGSQRELKGKKRRVDERMEGAGRATRDHTIFIVRLKFSVNSKVMQ
jgi:hypothetical protein